MRAGILAVTAARSRRRCALGLTRGQAHAARGPAAGAARHRAAADQPVPQLTKNSSLAVAIGYPDLVSIANTTINQTGQAIEGIAIIMAVYLTISLSISAL